MKNVLMFVVVILLFINSKAMANCDDLYERRGESLDLLNQAMNCYSAMLGDQTLNKAQKVKAMADQSYLIFFKAEYFQNDNVEQMEIALNKAKSAAEIFGKLHDFKVYRTLNVEEKKSLSMALYQFGTITARYVDLKGKWEAVKRMGDIKKSMSSIIRLKEGSTAHYGAYRTLAIFYLKVPPIAGGSIEKSKKYFDTLMKESVDENGLSSYPLNNMVYSDYLFEVKNKSQACNQLKLVKSLTESDILALENNLVFETKKHVREAARRFAKNKCQ